MVAPVRFTSGFTQSAPAQPLGQMGIPNPMFYYSVFDDFDYLNADRWVVTDTSTAPTSGFETVAGVGGVLQAVSAATAATGSAVQADLGTLQLTAATAANAGPKVFFATRISASLAANAVIIAGLTNDVALALPTTTITDGVWVSKANAAGFFLNYRIASGTIQSVAIPVPADTIANSEFIDITIEQTTQGEFLATVGVNNAGRVRQNDGALAPAARLVPATYPLTSVLLLPSVGMWAGTAAANTFAIDYILAAQER